MKDRPGNPNDRDQTRDRHRQETAGLARRINDTLEQCRRFETMSQTLQEWAEHWSTETLARWLNLGQLPIEEREKALIALALQATAEAGAVIDAYDPYGHGRDHELLYRVARIEWEQRSRAPRARRSKSLFSN